MNDRNAEVFNVLDVIASRRSSRKFTEEGVSKDILTKIVDAGRLAATGRNVQPWHFVVVTDAAKRKRIADITEYGKFIADCPACIVVACEDTTHYLEDGCAATQNMLLAAEALGLGTCWVVGDKKPYARDILDVVDAPAGIKLVATIAVGHSADESARPAKKSIDQVIHWETF